MRTEDPARLPESTQKTRRFTAPCTAAIVALVGVIGLTCVNPPPPPPPPGRPGPIGPLGGSVDLADGARLVVPAGALGVEVALTVEKTSETPPVAGALSSLYRFGPEGTHFAVPVQIRLPAPTAPGDARLYWSKDGASGYDALGATVENGEVVALVTHFSSGFVGPAPAPTCSLASPCQGGVCTCPGSARPPCQAPATCCASDADCTGGDVCNGGYCEPPPQPISCASTADCPCGDVNRCECPGGTADCAGGCFDTTADPANCGSCGAACSAAQACCGSACADLRTDEANCGACGKVCAAGEQCVGGACVARCMCTSDAECLPAPGACTGGKCGCSAAVLSCQGDGDCFNSSVQVTDVDGGACTCSGGICCGPVKSTPGTYPWDGSCTANADCAECGSATACVAGACTAGTCPPPACTAGQTLCGSDCVTLSNDPGNCGGCGATCERGLFCRQGTCEQPPPPSTGGPSGSGGTGNTSPPDGGTP